MTTQPKRRRRTPAEMEKARRRREAARKRNLRVRHHMTPEEYDELLAFQGGHCYMCPARGVTRALAVDHDHAIARQWCDHPHDQSCRRCWRGLVCSRDNDTLAHARDVIEVFERFTEYLRDPPAQRWLCQQTSQSQPYSNTTAPASTASASTDGDRSVVRSTKTSKPQRASTSPRARSSATHAKPKATR